MQFILHIFIYLLMVPAVTKHTVNTKVIELEFSDPQLDIMNSTAQINLFLAGVGSGKTFIIGARTAIFTLLYPHVRGFIGANTYQQLSKSTLVGVFKFWASVGLKRDINYVVDRHPPEGWKVFGEKLKSYDNTISFANGKLFFLGSLDNYKAIDGQEFAHADLDESKDTKEEAVKEVILARLRQSGLWVTPSGKIVTSDGDNYQGFCPLGIYTSPAKTDWISEWFSLDDYVEEINESVFEKDNYFRKRIGDKLVVICSTYHNEHNLPSGYIESKLIGPNSHNQNRINMLVFGYPFAKTGGEYFIQFDRLKHIKLLPVNEKLPVHISLDFNLYPYVTLTCYQTWWTEETKKWTVYKFDEVLTETPKNNTEDACIEFLFRWEHLLKNGLFYYGDYSGKTNTTNSKEHNYKILERVLRKYIGAYSDKVIVNDNIDTRKNFMNKVLLGTNPEVPIEYYQAPHCKKSISEYEHLKEDPNGAKLKQMVKDKDTKKSYQKYGHIADADEYFFTSAFSQFYNN
jgi:hypothetical protein